MAQTGSATRRYGTWFVLGATILAGAAAVWQAGDLYGYLRAAVLLGAGAFAVV